MSKIVAVYSDGGMVGPQNPSELGVTWAWCHVGEDGEQLKERSGVLTPEELYPDGSSRTLSNNVAEYVALARCLRALPDGWSGTVYSDSGVTLGRFFNGYANRGIPDRWVKAVQELLPRLGVLCPILLGGHPTKAELAAGVRKRDGKPVSIHNCWCDQACTRAAQAFLSEKVDIENGNG